MQEILVSTEVFCKKSYCCSKEPLLRQLFSRNINASLLYDINIWTLINSNLEYSGHQQTYYLTIPYSWTNALVDIWLSLLHLTPTHLSHDRSYIFLLSQTGIFVLVWRAVYLGGYRGNSGPYTLPRTLVNSCHHKCSTLLKNRKSERRYK